MKRPIHCHGHNTSVIQLANAPMCKQDKRAVGKRKKWKKKRVKLHAAETVVFDERVSNPWPIVKR